MAWSPLGAVVSRFLAAALVAATCATRVAADSGTYAQQVAAARAARLKDLTAPDGWLSLIGRLYLQPGINTIGSASDNSIMIDTGPAHWGAVNVEKGKALFTPVPGVQGTVDGKPLHACTLAGDEGDDDPTVVASGRVSFQVIDRGGRKILRVKDSTSIRLVRFAGLQYFSIDPSWRIQARWVPFEKPQKIKVPNVLGSYSMEDASGRVVFERSGRTYALVPLVEDPDDHFFFIFSDATSGKQSHEMRFLYADKPQNGLVTLDFNLAENPPCAFTPFATCPLPPKGNTLDFEVTAGEKKYLDPVAPASK